MQNRVAELGLDFEAAHAVSSIYRAANAVRGYVTTEVLRPVDISWTGFVVMWVVWIADGLETRHAADSAAISKATLTGVVKTLEARGWMEKVGREDDRRLVELHLTSSGKALMEDLYPKFNSIESRVVRGISSTPAEDDDQEPARHRHVHRGIRVRRAGRRLGPTSRHLAPACDALQDRLDERREDAGLSRISGRGVLWVPLDPEVPPVVVVQGDRLDSAVLGVRRRAQPVAKPAESLVVVAGDRHPVFGDDRPQW